MHSSDRVGVVTDSIGCLPDDLVKEFQIGIMPIRLLVNGKVYRDSVDLTPSQAYKLFLEDPESFKTSPASPGDYMALFRQMAARNSRILCITVSSRLSTAYNAACLAREQARQELDSIAIEIIDSRTATAAQGFVALEAARAARQNGDLAWVSEQAIRVKDKVEFFAFLQTMRHVYRTGRVPRIAASIGSGLNIKPILTCSSGAIRFKTIARNTRQGMEKLLDIMRGKVGDRSVHAAVMHAYAPEQAEDLRQLVAGRFDCRELWISEFSPVMGYSTGTGTLGLAFYTYE